MTWAFPAWAESNSDMPLAVGADLSPETLTQAHQMGYYPMPPTNEYWRQWNEDKYGYAVDNGEIPNLGGFSRFTLPWWSPAQRAVLTAATARLGRKVKQALRDTGWTTTVDAATRTVIENCGPQRGQETWLKPELAAGYIRLSEQNVVHSVEVWDADGELIGGTFGILTGTILTAESAFRTRPNVARVAVLEALLRLRDAGGDLLDAQVNNSYLASVGVVEIPKREFHERLDAGRHRQLALPTERRTLERLLTLNQAAI